jgi:hypothetical protein
LKESLERIVAAAGAVDAIPGDLDPFILAKIFLVLTK